MSKSQKKMIIWLNTKRLKFELLDRGFKVGNKRYLPKWVYGNKICLYRSDRKYLEEYPDTIVAGFNDRDSKDPIIEMTLEQLTEKNHVEYIDRNKYKNIKIPFNQYLIMKAYCKKKGITLEVLIADFVKDIEEDVDRLFH